MPQALKVGVFAAIVLAVIGFFVLKIEDLRLFGAEGRRVDARFESVAGLDDKAAVRVAGVRVGKVDGIRLEGRSARVSLLLEQEVELTEGSKAVIASTGLLGDKYVELVPGPSGAPLLPPGAVLPGETPVTLDQAIARIDAIGSNIQQITGSLAGGGAGDTISRLLANLEVVSQEVRELIAANREAVSGTIRNFESASATLARELPRLAERMEAVLAEVGGLVAENRGNVSASLENIAQITRDIQPAIADLKTISGRLAAGEGTIGKLLTSDEAHTRLVGTLSSIEGGVESLKDTLGAAQRIGLDLALEGYYLPEREKSQAGAVIDIDTRSDWLYRVAVVDPSDLVTRRKVQVITETLPDGSTQQRTIETFNQEEDLRFSALLGRRLGRSLTLRTGLIESKFGVQVDYPLFDDRLWLSLEAFDFSRAQDLDTHVRLSGRWRLHPNLYLMAGYDDPLVSDRRAVLFGAGIRWKDDDLKYLLGSLPSF